MSRILVTGGCGFIGSHVVDALLARGDAVTVLDDLSSGHRRNLAPGAELIVGSVADPGHVARAMAGVDACIHLAAIASVARCTDDWLAAHRTNVGGLIAVLEQARARGGVPVVYASSAAVYGDSAAPRVCEDAPTAPRSAYGADKLGCELHAGIARLLFGVPTLGLRFFNVFGPRQDGASPYSGVISIFCDRLRRGDSLTVFGDGGQSRDFVYVADVVAAVLAGLDRIADVPPVLNVCRGTGVSVLDLAASLGRLRGITPRIDFAPNRPGDIRMSTGDPAAMIRHLGLRPTMQLEDGLRLTLSSPRIAA